VPDDMILVFASGPFYQGLGLETRWPRSWSRVFQRS